MTAFPTIIIPDNFFGVTKRPAPTSSNPDRKKAAFDGAHATGTANWRDNFGEFAERVDPDGNRGFNPDARWNGVPNWLVIGPDRMRLIATGSSRPMMTVASAMARARCGISYAVKVTTLPAARWNG